MKTRYYLVCTDFASIGVGPFNTLKEIEEHRNFLHERGDADAVGVVITEDQLDDAEYLELDTITPAQDRADQQFDAEGSCMTDVEADADTLASAGMGTDEDYGYYGDDQ